MKEGRGVEESLLSTAVRRPEVLYLDLEWLEGFLRAIVAVR